MTFFCARKNASHFSLSGAKKRGGEKLHKGRSPTAVFRSPSRLLVAKHIQTCYATYRIF
jgi:hypothetical protein